MVTTRAGEPESVVEALVAEAQPKEYCRDDDHPYTSGSSR